MEFGSHSSAPTRQVLRWDFTLLCPEKHEFVETRYGDGQLLKYVLCPTCGDVSPTYVRIIKVEGSFESVPR